MTPLRFVPVRPDIIGWDKNVRSAHDLYIFLLHHQTDPKGNVNYGKPFGYAWIRSRWLGIPEKRPSIRTLKRKMANLKKYGYVVVRAMPFNWGMRVQVLDSPKWSPQAAARQLSLFSTEPQSISSGKAAQNPRERAPHVVTQMSPDGGHKCPPKDLKRQANTTPLPPYGGSNVVRFEWCGEIIEVGMGRRKRLPNLEPCIGARAPDVVGFLSRKGFQSRIVRDDELSGSGASDHAQTRNGS